MKCYICGKSVKDHPGAVVSHMACLRSISKEIRDKVKAGWPARAEKGNEYWVKEG